MNLKAAQTLAKCHRPGSPALQDPQVQKAARIIEADPALKAALAAQVAYDELHAATVATIKPAEEFLDRIDATLEHLQKGFHWKNLLHPSILSGVIAVLVLIGVLVYTGRDWMENFHGRENAEQLIDFTAAKPATLAERWTKKSVEAGSLQDWFFTQGYESFHLLPEFAHAKTDACRVLKKQAPVAQISFPAQEGNPVYLSIFHGDELDIHVDPSPDWKIFEHGDWVSAIRTDADTSFMVAFRGKRSDMQDYVDNLRKLAAAAPAQ